MAIIGKLSSLESFFAQHSFLNTLHTYLLDALKPQSPIHQRIIKLDSPIEVVYPQDLGIRAIEQSYTLKAPQKAFFETHRRYVDFQLIVQGYEYMLLGDRSDFTIHTPYDENRDLVIYENAIPSDSQNRFANNTKHPISESLGTPLRTQILMNAGDLAIFFPDDVHAGGLELTPNRPTPSAHLVKKSVAKVPFDLFAR
ncbi:DUF386 family protein [Helicobacter sp. MIT 05-5293]|uniref:YhcH/YjgK/YiaL family protein n=1 Tax=Helicobacter sp. MIT 05-5293 TaxID=1548149 RepID=UPI00051DA729|nr:YhcH/YjgK/YiaL family protein [Helicobacter sp. MIT 05-5293]TLD82125.1 DUF386 family protein [Helicobacter sp. MIT 05-5293]